MTQDDTIRMAREAGWTGPEDNAVYFSMLKRLIELARAAEREACAKVCEAQGEYGWRQYADAIRARGQA